mmetsp:Transcript_155816/g.498008  ORF Transcript_155816/g.498008 Transcript_155816/m.498008 type:complete len:1047 (+) Transcript_155816:108-3248(+)
MRDKSYHPIAEVEGIAENVDLIRADVLASAGAPWERCQDLPRDKFAQATRDHYVLAVSHGWAYQTHPDPNGVQAQLLHELISKEVGSVQSLSKTLIFLDFVSTPQHAFSFGQENRTKEQSDRFSRALKLFPQIYLMADATLHINGGVDDPIIKELHTYSTTIDELRGAKLEQMGDSVQVTEWPGSSSIIVPFDTVLQIEGRAMRTLADVQRAMQPKSEEIVQPRFSDSFARLFPSFICCALEGTTTAGLVLMRRCPHGIQNNSPVMQRGWVFLERFVSMVKCAMVPASQMQSVAFSDNRETLYEIFDGGRKLRVAAGQGPERLKQQMREFVGVLDSMRFKSTSVDKLKNVGGVGGVSSPHAASDRDVVKTLMEGLVEHLAQHWEREAKLQQQRQLILAVGRNSIEDVHAALAAGADPNATDVQGLTSLHLAAALHHHEAAKLLLEYKGDLHIQDRLGNCPAHKVALLSVLRTIQTFQLLAPGKAELTLKNEAGITPYMRFEVWVQTELANKPFGPAKAHLDKTRKTVPDIDSVSAALLEQNIVLTPVSSYIRQCRVGDRTFGVRVWEPCLHNASLTNMVCLSFEYLVPARLAEPAWHTLARAVCNRWSVRMWVLDYNVISDEALQATSFVPLHDDVVAAIDALKIEGKFVLVDSSLGETTPVVWRLHPRIMESLIINFGGFHSQDFASADMCPKLQKRFGMIKEFCRFRNCEEMSKLLGDYAYQEGLEQMKATVDLFKDTALREPAAFFEHAAFHCKMIEEDIMERTRMYQSFERLENMKGIIACGAFAPAMWTLEAAPRLHELLPETSIQYIHMGKSCWAMEGTLQALQVSKVIGTCFKKINIGRSDCCSSVEASKTEDKLEFAFDLLSQQEVDTERKEKAAQLYHEVVEPVFPGLLLCSAAEVRFSFDQILLVDCRPKAYRAVSTIPGSFTPDQVNDEMLETMHMEKHIVVFCDIGDVSKQYLHHQHQRCSSKLLFRWQKARVMTMGMAGWCHDGGMLADSSGKMTLKLGTSSILDDKEIFPVGYEIQRIKADFLAMLTVRTSL